MTQYSCEGVIEFSGHTVERVSVANHNTVTGELGALKAKPSAWPDPPHVALSNSSPELNAVVAFTKKYGPLKSNVQFADKSRAFGPGGVRDAATVMTPEKARNLEIDGVVRETFSFSHNAFGEYQDRLRLAWRGDRLALDVLREVVKGADFQVSLLQNDLGRPEKVLLRTPLLWDFICLTFLIDYDSGRARICQNPRCKTPYFLQQRVDQQCCSHSCSVEKNNLLRAQQKARA